MGEEKNQGESVFVYIGRRIVYVIPIVISVALVCFMLVHITPGDPGYGTALWGFHYYTWAVIGFGAANVLIAAVLLCDSQFKTDDTPRPVAFTNASLATQWR